MKRIKFKGGPKEGLEELRDDCPLQIRDREKRGKISFFHLYNRQVATSDPVLYKYIGMVNKRGEPAYEPEFLEVKSLAGPGRASSTKRR